MVILEKMVNQAPVDFLALREKMVHWDHRVRRDQEVFQVLRAQKEIQDLQDFQEMRVALGHLDLKDWMACLVSMEIQDH